ncbi:hypothetical protein IFR05_015926 [Cadophora sp. M221]|nr:hypothetical protein IFR05_015926 [Cadophora sp. M221]
MDVGQGISGLVQTGRGETIEQSHTFTSIFDTEQPESFLHTPIGNGLSMMTFGAIIKASGAKFSASNPIALGITFLWFYLTRGDSSSSMFGSIYNSWLFLELVYWMRSLRTHRRMGRHWLLLPVLFVVGFANGGSSYTQMLIFTIMVVRSFNLRHFFNATAPAQ